MANTRSVKISSNAKVMLGTIQKKLRAVGIKVTEQEILDILIEHADINAIKKLLRKEENEALIMLKEPVDWGIDDSSKNVDKYLYE